MIFRRPVGLRLVLTVAVFPHVAAVAADAVERPMREAFVVETDGTAEKKLASVAEYVAQERWDAAISLLREVAVARPETVVRVSPRRSLSLPLYCDILLSRLPKAGLQAYRAGADPQAAAWLAEADATSDERALRSISERAFVSSAGDEAVYRLAEAAWERGEFDLARRYWTLLVPLGEVPQGRTLPAVLRYPETDIDLAPVRARLVLCSIALGQLDRAARELSAFRRLHPEANGHLLGREGRLADTLRDVLASVGQESTNESRGGWDILPLSAATRTFGQSAGRSGFVPFEPLAAAPLWFRHLPESEYRTDDGRPALPDLEPLCHYPVVWKDKVFVADAEQVFGFELSSGKAAWAVGDDDPGLLYPPSPDLTLDGLAAGSPFAANPLGGVPRHTLTVEGDRLYARLGPPITSPAARDLRRRVSTLVCLDLSREGLLAWSVSSDSLGGGDEDWWAFEGPPVADGNRLYALATRSRPQAQLNALCLDPATGAVVWNRAVGAPITPPPEGLDGMTHRLVTSAAGRLYVQTNYGAMVCLDAADGRTVWVAWYESAPATGDATNTSDRNLPAAPLFSGGVLIAAPADSDLLLAYDAESGVELWSREVRGGGRELVGAQDGVLVVSGERLAGLDLFTGRELWTTGFEDPAGCGAGRGLLAGRFVYWPTREELLVVDVTTGDPVRRVLLADVYGLAGGGNLAASPERLLIAGPEGLAAFGEP